MREHSLIVTEHSEEIATKKTAHDTSPGKRKSRGSSVATSPAKKCANGRRKLDLASCRSPVKLKTFSVVKYSEDSPIRRSSSIVSKGNLESSPILGISNAVNRGSTVNDFDSPRKVSKGRLLDSIDDNKENKPPMFSSPVKLSKYTSVQSPLRSASKKHSNSVTVETFSSPRKYSRKLNMDLEAESNSFNADSSDDEAVTTVEYDLRSPAKGVSFRKVNINKAAGSPCKAVSSLSASEQSSVVRRSPRKSPKKCYLNSPLRKLSLKTGEQGSINVSHRKISAKQDEPKVDAETTKLLSAIRQSLSHTPGQTLVGRDEEMGAMTQFLKSRLEGCTSGAMYVSGAPGTGKTAGLTQILSGLSSKKNSTIKVIWVNCMGVQCSSGIYSRIADKLGLPAQGSELKTIRAIENYMCTRKNSVVLVLDEVDQLETRHQQVLYTLFEWPSLQDSRLILIGIANRLDLTERVLPRLLTGPSAPERLHFPPYTKDQIVEIITDRLDRSEQDWKKVLKPPTIKLLGAKVAAVAGDARRAIDVCRRAVETCSGNVSMQSVLAIFNEVYGNRVVEAVTSAPHALPLQQKLLLCCLLLVTRHGKTREPSVAKLQEVYRAVCAHRGVRGDDVAAEFLPLCRLLEARGMLALGRHREARQARVSLRLQEAEAERVLADRALMEAVLRDREALGRLARKA